MSWERTKAWVVDKMLPLLAWAILSLLTWVSIFVARVDTKISYLEQRILATDVRLTNLFQEMRTFAERVDRMETPLARRVDAIEAYVRALNDRQTELSATQVSRWDQNTQNHARIEERMNRIVQALDSTYDLLNQHLREEHGKKPPP